MLGTVVSKIQQKVGILITQWSAKVSQLKTLFKTIIAHGIDRVTLTALYIKPQFAQIKLSIKAYLVQSTPVVSSIKAGLMTVIHKVGQLGLQLVTIVRQIPQRVLSLLKQGR